MLHFKVLGIEVYLVHLFLFVVVLLIFVTSFFFF